MYSLTLLDDNLINRFDEDPSFSLQNSSPLTSSKRKQQYDGGLSDFLHWDIHAATLQQDK